MSTLGGGEYIETNSSDWHGTRVAEFFRRERQRFAIRHLVRLSRRHITRFAQERIERVRYLRRVLLADFDVHRQDLVVSRPNDLASVRQRETELEQSVNKPNDTV